jgi:hypothetical protein
MDSTKHTDSSLPVEGASCGQRRDLLTRWFFLGIATAAYIGSITGVLGATVTTRSYDSARTGWNQNETTLKPSNVNPNTFHKIGELRVDDKIESSPLFVPGVTTSSGPRDLLIVATTNNTVYAFDAQTNAQVWSRPLGPPGVDLKPAPYKNWGVTSTPVIDPDTNTLYIVRLVQESGLQLYRLVGLRLFDGTEEIQSQLIDGNSVKRSNTKFFDVGKGKQIIRTALSLWRNGAGQKAIIFGASGGEGGGASGWIIAYNVARLRAGGNVAPAFWCSTAGDKSGGGGIWMASQGLAIDESDPNRDIYFATGNGPYAEVFGADDLGESVVRLRYDPNANTLNVVDWFAPFTDESHDINHKDQDLAAAGVLLVPKSQSVLAGGKEGIFYNVNRSNMGKRSHGSLFQLDFIGSFTQAPGTDFLADTNKATTTDGVDGSRNDERTFIPDKPDGGRTRHIHGGPAYFEKGAQRLIYVMGENSTLRAFEYNGNIIKTPAIAESAPDTATSGNTPPPGGMPGGFLTVTSSNASGTDGIVWSVAPLKSMWRDPAANAVPIPSILRAFNAVPAGGSMTELWNSEVEVSDAIGSASKWQPPLVADGKVYVVTYDNKVVVYGTTAPHHTPRDIHRTMVLIKAQTQPGQDLFLRGGIDQTFGNSNGRNCPTTNTPDFGDTKRYNCAIRIEHRNTINYGQNHEDYPITNSWQLNDRYFDWYGQEEFQTFQRRRLDEQGKTQEIGLAQGTPLDWTTNDIANMNSVLRQGFGFLKENQDNTLGDNYWMLDVDMDCESAVNFGGTFWFEVRSFMTNTPNNWEPDVNQADRPYPSGNHFAKCGKINIFERGSSAVRYADFDTVNQCSILNQERRCDAGVAQVCGSAGGAKIWQTSKVCVESNQLCQITTGQCCTPSNGPGSNRNCL